MEHRVKEQKNCLDISASPVGVFDSGIGGLTTLSEMVQLCPNESFIYYADNLHMPYGNMAQDAIVAAALYSLGQLSEMGAKSLVVACNTATTSAVSKARESFSKIVVGIEPALLPAVRMFSTEKILVLCTEATAKQQKFLSLVERCGNNQTVVLPQKNLAKNIEDNIFRLKSLTDEIENILLPHLDAKAVVLGCTHYIYISGIIRDIFLRRSQQTVIFDGNYGVAKQLVKRMAEENILNKSSAPGKVKIVCSLPEEESRYHKIFRLYCSKKL